MGSAPRLKAGGGYNEQIGAALSELSDLFENFGQVKLAYLFGSRARGTPGPLSDYDFAVYLDEQDHKKIFEIQSALLDQLQRRLGTDNVQVVVLNLVESPELKYSVIASGTLLYEQEPFKLLVEPRILNEYFDFHQLLKRHGLTRS